MCRILWKNQGFAKAEDFIQRIYVLLLEYNLLDLFCKENKWWKNVY